MTPSSRSRADGDASARAGILPSQGLWSLSAGMAWPDGQAWRVYVQNDLDFGADFTANVICGH